MRTLAWIFFLVAASVVAFLAYSVMEGTVRDPRELIANAERMRSGAEPDLQAALEELDLALRMAQAEPDQYAELVGPILAARGQVLAEMGLLAQGRADLERVLSDYDPDNLEAQVQLATILIETEELDEALSVLASVLARDPSRADAWTLQSLALVTRADELLAEAEEYCRDALPDHLEREASELLARASGLEVEDPARVTLLLELRELFELGEEEAARGALQLVDEASEKVTSGRRALAESFRSRSNRKSLYDFLRLMDRSGRDELTVAYGLTAINDRAAAGNHVFVRTMMEALLRDQRPDAAVDLVNTYFKGQDVLPDMDFYRVWTEALYESEQWKPLLFVSNTMRNAALEDEDRALAYFYLGSSQVALEQYYEAPGALREFASQTLIEPYRYARDEAWTTLANCLRAQNKTSAEKEALRGGLTGGAEWDGAGEHWLRLAELIELTEPDSLPEALDAWTHGMRLAPERSAELEEHWRELGEKILRSSRGELSLVYRTLVASGRLVPDGRPGPYELLRLAEMHAADGRPSGAAACTRRLLSTHPGFLPALDLFVESALAIPDQEAAALMLFDRVKRAGPTLESIDMLRSLPTAALSPELRLELMRLDPERNGRLTVVQELRDEGRSLEALVGLRWIPDEELDDESRLLLAGLAFDQSRYEFARQTLARVPESSHRHEDVLDLSLAIAVRARDVEGLPELIGEVISTHAPDVGTLLASAEEMLLAELYSPAIHLLSELDARADTRDGSVMARLAMAHWLAGNADETEEHLLRAEAYDTGGAPELGLLIRAVDERRWTDLRWLVSDLENSSYVPAPIEAAILDILREMPEQAEETLAANRDTANPEERARWLVVETALDLFLGRRLSEGADELRHALVGRGGGDRDPRQLLVRMLALEHPDWTAWATVELGRARMPDEGSLWPTYLAALGLERLGQTERARASAQKMLTTWEGFGPAWDMLERIATAELGRPDAPRLLRIQQQRRRALGRGGPRDQVPDLRTRALVQAEEGELEEALIAIREALDLDPDAPESQLVFADLQRRRGEWKPALHAYGRACEGRPESSDDYMVGDFLAFMRQIQDVDPALETLMRSAVERLGEHFPDDPMVALARARTDLTDLAVSPEIRLSRAYERLERFRASVAPTNLEDLRKGSTRAWVDFYLERDAARAHALVTEELLRKPGSIDLWLMLGETENALGQRPEAVVTLELLLRMLPEGRTARATARMLANDGAQIERVRDLIALTEKLESIKRRDDFELRLILARALGNNVRAGSRRNAIEMLLNLWERRDRATSIEQKIEIGELLGVTLAWTDPKEGADRRLAHEVLREVEPLVEDPARRNMLRAVGNLVLR